jgi:hypothetical protein
VFGVSVAGGWFADHGVLPVPGARTLEGDEAGKLKYRGDEKQRVRNSSLPASQSLYTTRQLTTHNGQADKAL